MLAPRTTTVPATPAGPGAAREFVRSALSDCSQTEVVSAAELMASELVTNSVLHGSPPIHVNIRHDADSVRVAVDDAGVGHPTPGSPQEDDPNGRGLFIVRSLAQDWGVVEHAPGKSVWFSLPCSPSAKQR